MFDYSSQNGLLKQVAKALVERVLLTRQRQAVWLLAAERASTSSE
jgi:hypothetical protein